MEIAREVTKKTVRTVGPINDVVSISATYRITKVSFRGLIRSGVVSPDLVVSISSINEFCLITIELETSDDLVISTLAKDYDSLTNVFSNIDDIVAVTISAVFPQVTSEYVLVIVVGSIITP